MKLTKLTISLSFAKCKLVVNYFQLISVSCKKYRLEKAVNFWQQLMHALNSSYCHLLKELKTWKNQKNVFQKEARIRFWNKAVIFQKFLETFRNYQKAGHHSYSYLVAVCLYSVCETQYSLMVGGVSHAWPVSDFLPFFLLEFFEERFSWPLWHAHKLFYEFFISIW